MARDNYPLPVVSCESQPAAQDIAAVQGLHRPCVHGVDGPEFFDIRLGSFNRFFEDGPSDAFSAWRRRQRSLVTEDAAVSRQEKICVDRCLARLFAMLFRNIAHEACKGFVLCAGLYQDADNGEIVLRVCMDDVNFERGLRAVDLMLARRMEMELLQRESFAVEHEAAAGLRIGLQCMTIIHEGVIGRRPFEVQRCNVCFDRMREINGRLRCAEAADPIGRIKIGPSRWAVRAFIGPMGAGIGTCGSADGASNQTGENGAA